jgi:hypothetical protein
MTLTEGLMPRIKHGFKEQFELGTKTVIDDQSAMPDVGDEASAEAGGNSEAGSARRWLTLTQSATVLLLI